MNHYSLPVCSVGHVASRKPEPLTVSIARYLVMWSGGGSINSANKRQQQSSPVFLVCYFMNLLSRGYSLIWRSALFDYPASLAMFEWKLWRTETAILSASADIQIEQSQKQRAVLSSGAAVSSLLKPVRKGSSNLSSSSTAVVAMGQSCIGTGVELIHQLIFRILAMSQTHAYSRHTTVVLLEIGRCDPVRLIRALGFAAK